MLRGRLVEAASTSLGFQAMLAFVMHVYDICHVLAVQSWCWMVQRHVTQHAFACSADSPHVLLSCCRFDWFFKSRTPQELARRAETLIRLVEKEQEDENVSATHAAAATAIIEILLRSFCCSSGAHLAVACVCIMLW